MKCAESITAAERDSLRLEDCFFPAVALFPLLVFSALSLSLSLSVATDPRFDFAGLAGADVEAWRRAFFDGGEGSGEGEGEERELPDCGEAGLEPVCRERLTGERGLGEEGSETDEVDAWSQHCRHERASSSLI